MGTRVTRDTADPRWVTGLRGRLNDHLVILKAAPFVRAAAAGPRALDRAEMRRFMVLIGNAIIRNFPDWLDVLQARAGKSRKRLLKLFARLNRVQERHHWIDWGGWGAVYGVRLWDYEPAYAPVHESPYRLTMHLDRLVMFGSLLHAVAALNLVIESLSAELSTIVYQGLGSSLSERAGLWLKEHAEGDPAHSADAWELVKRLAAAEKQQFNLSALQRVVDQTAKRFNAALCASYRSRSHRARSRKTAGFRRKVA